VHDSQAQTVDILGIACDRQSILAETNGVSSLGNSCVFFKISLCNEGGRSVDFHGKNADVFAAIGGSICIRIGNSGRLIEGRA
jgi:hypothetical protein